MTKEENVKIKVFEEALWQAYLKVQDEEHVVWVSLHKVMKYVGMSRELFTERLEQLWKAQFIKNSTNRYTFGLEVDATPTEMYRLRKQRIYIEGVARFIINMGPIKES